MMCSMVSLLGAEVDAARDLVRNRLRKLGISANILKKVANGAGIAGKKRSCAPGSVGVASSSSVMRTPGKGGASVQCRVFGRPLRDLSMVIVDVALNIKHDNEDADGLMVPKFLVSICEWLKNPDNLSVEGIFRKSGSSVRQKNLRASIESSENWTQLLSEASVLDVASLLKQWLRELPESLLPIQYQKLFTECWTLPDSESRLEALQLSCCLLPLKHVSTLMYLLKFFSGVAACSEASKMDISNLAIVLTPTFFPVEGDGKTDGESLAKKTKIIEALIQHADKVGYLSSSVEASYQETMNLPSQSDDNLEYDDPMPGPSERRRNKKKRRSGSISRVVTATMKSLHKAISRSTTPVAPSRMPLHTTGELSFHSTPLPQRQKDARFTSPRLPPKRKARVEHELSPSSKQYRSTGLEVGFTPKARSRSFSVKKFKRKKSLGDGSDLAVLNNLTPLPNKPKITLSVATPATPDSLGLPRSGCDIASPESVDKDLTDGPASFVIDKSSAEGEQGLSSRLQSSSISSASSHTYTRKSRSPGDRKIGMVRKRSQVMRKESDNASTENIAKLVGSKSCMPNAQEIKQQLRKGSSNVRAGRSNPLKAPPIKDAQQSLTNLREDLNSFIEKSFVTDDFSELQENPNGVTTRLMASMDVTNSMRRQSSAFEFSRPAPSASEGFPAPNAMLRRQSSAFEIAARNRQQHPSQTYEPSLTRGGSDRASLKRRDSSVKDLIKKLENTSSSSLPFQRSAMVTPRGQPKEVENKVNEEEEWMDANEFFKTPTLAEFLQEESSGSKRSSIVKIRQENRGKVFQSVKTFTKPAPPGSRNQPREPVKETVASPRRLSARMGIAKTSNVVTPLQNRKQTLTGIRTSVNYKKTIPVRASPAATPDEVRKPTSSKKDSNSIKVHTPSRAIRRGKRLEGRRNLTIGYTGEVRTPLKERQNMIATVQRSKSAQTPLQSKPTMKKKMSETDENLRQMVTRSQSTRSPQPRTPSCARRTASDLSDRKKKRYVSKVHIQPYEETTVI